MSSGMENGMTAKAPSGTSEPRKGYWWRVLRPLIWWLLLVLLLLAIHEHQIWIERTRIYFSVTMYEANVLNDAVVTLDGQPVRNGDKLWLGSHHLTVTQPKAVSLDTNFFAGYGRHDLGKINLKRTMGTLNVTAEPPAKSIDIIGPEFSLLAYDSSGTNLKVPADQYVIVAKYAHWSQSQQMIVSRESPSSCAFSPRLGGLHVMCNHEGATYSLQLTNGKTLDNGNLPATVTDLPVGGYHLTISYHNRQIQKSVMVEPGITNDVPFEFVLGGARLDTLPSGAKVYTANGDYLGQTPLDEPDIPPQTMEFKLSLYGYEPVTVSMEIMADQTNTVYTNLLNVRYGEGLQEARTAHSSGNYEALLRLSREVLEIKPDDSEARSMEATATERLKATRERVQAEEQRVTGERERATAATKAEKERIERLNLPHDYFVKWTSETPGSEKFAEQCLTVKGDVGDLRGKIADALSKSILLTFNIEQNDQPFLGGFLIRAKHPELDGFRRCYIVGGQTMDGEVTIFFKVMEYTLPPGIGLKALVDRPADGRCILIDESPIPQSLKDSRREMGIKIVMERVKQASQRIEMDEK